MSADPGLVIEVVPPGQGVVLDLGGGRGIIRHPLEKLGYQYINVDIRPGESRGASVVGNAEILPFKEESFDLLISKDSLEHFVRPWPVVKEVYRVLKYDGLFIIWVPFMHPFHGDDFYRYSPLGLRHLLNDFQIISFESPLWVFTVVGSAVTQLLKRMHLGFLARPVKRVCSSIDRVLTRRLSGPSGFAAAYRIVARKASPRKGNTSMT